jgi:hypothetical protein
MRRGRIITGVVAACALALLGVTSALAVSSSRNTSEAIYRDYADNGRLDGKYTKVQLERALKNAYFQQYTTTSQVTPPSQGPQGLAPAIKRKLRGNLAAGPTKGGLPFTGVDLALMAIGGAALLAFGAGLRRLGRNKA